MKNKMILLVGILIFLLMYLVLGIYGKFILCLILFMTSFILGIKKNKKLFTVSFLSLLIMPNIFFNFNINNLNFDKNGKFIHSKFEKHNQRNSYYYAICPFISEVCYAKETIGPLYYITITLKSKKIIIDHDYYNDYLGNVFFYRNATKREKYLDNKALSKTSILYKTLFIPLSKEDLIIYDYNIAKNFSISEILKKSNKCELLLYGAQNGWNNYRNQLIHEIENDTNNSCVKDLDKTLLYDNWIVENKVLFVEFLRTNKVKNYSLNM